MWRGVRALDHARGCRVGSAPGDGAELSPAPKPSSRLVGSLRHDHPLKPPKERVDVIRAPFSQAAIHFSGQDQPTSLGMSSVKDYVNVGVTGETLLQRCVRQRMTTRNDQ
jgi:hypothetical protein